MRKMRCSKRNSRMFGLSILTSCTSSKTEVTCAGIVSCSVSVYHEKFRSCAVGADTSGCSLKTAELFAVTKIEVLSISIREMQSIPVGKPAFSKRISGAFAIKSAWSVQSVSSKR